MTLGFIILAFWHWC